MAPHMFCSLLTVRNCPRSRLRVSHPQPWIFSVERTLAPQRLLRESFLFWWWVWLRPLWSGLVAGSGGDPPPSPPSLPAAGLSLGTCFGRFLGCFRPSPVCSGPPSPGLSGLCDDSRPTLLALVWDFPSAWWGFSVSVLRPSPPPFGPSPWFRTAFHLSFSPHLSGLSGCDCGSCWRVPVT